MSRISLYIPCYNGERYLAKAITGVLAQSRTPDEVFVVDDGSTDSSREIAKGFPVKLITHDQNRGLGAARNTALKHATGD